MSAWTQLFQTGTALFFLLLIAPWATVAAPLDQHDTTEIEYYPVADATGCYYNFQHYDEGDRIITNEPCLNCTCHNRMLMCYLRVCPFTKAIGQDCKVEKRADQCCPVITCPEVPVPVLSSSTTQSSTAVGHLDAYGCSIDGLFYGDGARVPSDPNKPCELCYCIRNKTACVMQQCTLEVEGCKPVYQEGVCCPVRYNCEHPDYNLLETTTRKLITTTTTTTTTLPTTTLAGPVDCTYDNEIYADGALIISDNRCERCYCMKGDIVCAVQKCNPTPLDKVNCTALPPKEGQCCPDSYQCDNMIEEDLEELTTGYTYTTPSLAKFDEVTVKPAEQKPEEEISTAKLPEQENEIGDETTAKEGEQEPVTLPTGEKEQPEQEKKHEKAEEVKPTEPTVQATEEPKEEEPTTVQPEHPDLNEIPEEHEIVTAGPHIPSHDEAHPEEEPETGSGEGVEQHPETTEPETEAKVTEVPAPHVTESVTQHPEQLPEEEVTVPEVPEVHTTEKGSSTEIPQKPETEAQSTELPSAITEKSEPATSEHPEAEEPKGTEPSATESPQKPESEVTQKPETETPLKPTAETPVDTERIPESQQVPIEEEGGQKPVEEETELPKEHVTTETAHEITEPPHVIQQITETAPEIGSGLPHEMESATGKPTELPVEEITEGKIKEEDKTTEAGQVPVTEGPEVGVTQPAHVPKGEKQPESTEKEEQVTEKPAEAEEGAKEQHTTEAGTTPATVEHKKPVEEEQVAVSEGESTEAPKEHITQEPHRDLPEGTEKQELATELPEQSTLPKEQEKSTEAAKESVTKKPSLDSTELPEEHTPAEKDEVTEPSKQQEEATKLPKAEVTSMPPSQETTQPPPEQEVPKKHLEVVTTEIPEKQETSKTQKPKEQVTEGPEQITEEPELITEGPELPGEKTEIPSAEHITEKPEDEEKEQPESPKQVTEGEEQATEKLPEQPSITEGKFEETTKFAEEPIEAERPEHPVEHDHVPESPEKETEKTIPEEAVTEHKIYGTETPAHNETPTEEGTTAHVPEKEEAETPKGKPEGETEKPEEEKETATEIPEQVTESKPEEEHTERSGATEIPTEVSKKSEGTTEHPGDLEHVTEEEHGIPGEGSCLVDGQTYKNNSDVPPINHCQVSCKCKSSILQCVSVQCTAPPANLQHCMPVYQGPDSCCPTYSCAVPGVTSMESDSHKMEPTEPTTTEALPATIGVNVIIPSEQGTVRPEGSTPRPDTTTAASGRDGTELPEFSLPQEHVTPHVTEYPAISSETPEVHAEATAKPEEHVPVATEHPEEVTTKAETEAEVEGTTKTEKEKPATEITKQETTPKVSTEEASEATTAGYPIAHDVNEEENAIEDHTEPQQGVSSEEPHTTQASIKEEGVTQAITEQAPEQAKGEGLTEVPVEAPTTEKEQVSYTERTSEEPTVKPSVGVTEKEAVTEGAPEVSTEMKHPGVTEGVKEGEKAIEEELGQVTTETEKEAPEATPAPVTISDRGQEVPSETPEAVTEPSKIHASSEKTTEESITQAGDKGIEPVTTEASSSPEKVTKPEVTTPAIQKEAEPTATEELLHFDEGGYPHRVPETSSEHKAEEATTETPESTEPSKEIIKSEEPVSHKTPEQSTEEEIMGVTTEHAATEKMPESISHVTDKTEEGQLPTHDEAATHVPGEPEKSTEPSKEEPEVTTTPAHITEKAQTPTEQPEKVSEHAPTEKPAEHGEEKATEGPIRPEEESGITEKAGEFTTSAYETTKKVSEHIPETSVPEKESTTLQPTHEPEGTKLPEKDSEGTTPRYIPPETVPEHTPESATTQQPMEGEKEGTTIAPSHVPEASTSSPAESATLPSESQGTTVQPSHVPETGTAAEGLPEFAGVTEKEAQTAPPESTTLPSEKETTQKTTKPFVYIPPVYEHDQGEAGYPLETTSPESAGTETPAVITEGKVSDITTESKVPSATHTTPSAESETEHPTEVPTITEVIPESEGSKETAGEPLVTERAGEVTEKSTESVETEKPKEEKEQVPSATEAAPETGAETEKPKEDEQKLIVTEKQPESAETERPAEHEEQEKEVSATERPKEQEEVPVVTEKVPEVGAGETESPKEQEEPAVTEKQPKPSAPEEQVPVTDAETPQVTEQVPKATAVPAEVTEPVVTVTAIPAEPSATVKEQESAPTEKSEAAVTEKAEGAVTEKAEGPTTAMIPESATEYVSPTKKPIEGEEARPTIPGEGQEPIEVTTESKAEEPYTSPTVTTTPKSLTTLFTSGPKEQEVTTKKSIPGELSTSAPSSVLTSTTTVPTPHDISEEPEYQAPVEEEDYEDQSAFGPGTCRYGGKVYVSAQQIPRDDPCDFCFCFRSDIICLQQSCPPPIPRCHEEPIRGFCCPRYECPVNMATSVNITTTTTTTTTTLPPHFLSHAYKGRAHRSGCQIQNKTYRVGEEIKSASGPCLHCTCGDNGQMRCDPKACSPEPMLRQMIAAAESRRRR